MPLDMPTVISTGGLPFSKKKNRTRGVVGGGEEAGKDWEERREGRGERGREGKGREIS